MNLPLKYRSMASSNDFTHIVDDEKVLSLPVRPVRFDTRPTTRLFSKLKLGGSKPGMPAAKRASSGAQKRKPKKKSGGKGWLSRVSLQDAADGLGALWKWGGAALAILPNIEEKMFDQTSTAVNITDAGTVTNLSNIAQGNDYLNRLGNSVRALRLRFDYLVRQNTTAAVIQTVRIIVFRDLMQSGADPSIGSILDSFASGEAAIVSAYLHYEYDRFDVLFDEVHTFSPATLGSSSQVVHRRLMIGINDHILFQNTTGADASNWQGGLFFLTVSNVAATVPVITFHSRLSFTDD